MVRYCAAVNCTNTVYCKGISLHTFPQNRALKLKWERFVREKRKNFKHATPYSALCSDHFKKDDFNNSIAYEMGFAKNRRLKEDSVPSIHKEKYSLKPTPKPTDRSLRHVKRSFKKERMLIMSEIEAGEVWKSVGPVQTSASEETLGKEDKPEGETEVKASLQALKSLQELKAEMTANAKSQNINETVIKEEPLEPPSEPLMDPTLSISEVKEEPLSEVEQSGHFVNNHSTSFEPGEVHQPGCISNINNQSLSVSTPVENVTFLVINKEILKQPSIMKMNACVQASVRPHKRSKGIWAVPLMRTIGVQSDFPLTGKNRKSKRSKIFSSGFCHRTEQCVESEDQAIDSDSFQESEDTAENMADPKQSLGSKPLKKAKVPQFVCCVKCYTPLFMYCASCEQTVSQSHPASEALKAIGAIASKISSNMVSGSDVSTDPVLGNWKMTLEQRKCQSGKETTDSGKSANICGAVVQEIEARYKKKTKDSIKNAVLAAFRSKSCLNAANTGEDSTDDYHIRDKTVNGEMELQTSPSDGAVQKNCFNKPDAFSNSLSVASSVNQDCSVSVSESVKADFEKTQDVITMETEDSVESLTESVGKKLRQEKDSILSCLPENPENQAKTTQLQNTYNCHHCMAVFSKLSQLQMHLSDHHRYKFL